MYSIYKKEMRTYFTSISAYLFIGFYLALLGYCIYNTNLAGGYASYAYSMASTTTIFIMLVPVLTMRIVAEENHQKTDQLLFTSPVSITKIILGKYLAMLSVFGIALLVACVYPLILGKFGDVNYKVAYMCVFTYLLFGATYMAIGMFISALTESQAIAAIVTFAIAVVTALISGFEDSIPSDNKTTWYIFAAVFALLMIAVYFMIKNAVVSVSLGAVGEIVMMILYWKVPTVYDGLTVKVLGSFSIIDRYYDFVYGELNIASVVYYITMSALFVFLTVQAINKRRWS
jgi:ABC-2 type transport system permease protein